MGLGSTDATPDDAGTPPRTARSCPLARAAARCGRMGRHQFGPRPSLGAWRARFPATRRATHANHDDSSCLLLKKVSYVSPTWLALAVRRRPPKSHAFAST